MIRTRPTLCRRSRWERRPRGFTMIELLVVMVILALLIALLLPAINAAMRTAKNAAISAEINQLAQALAAFKTKYGDFPPSRIYLSEDGNLQPVVANLSAPVAGAGDITYAQLGQRSIAAMRKFFPRVVFNLGTATGKWYDFNGDGSQVTNGVTQHYILQGHECLAFFLGGIPQPTLAGNVTQYGMSGFGKDPTNPFSNNIANGNNAYSGNRQPPLFEFVADRLLLDPNGTSGIPGYLDTTGNPLGGGTINFYTYFSAYGSGNYDPNDVNFTSEADAFGVSPIGLGFTVNFPVTGATVCQSAPPNPYTSSLSVLPTGAPSFQSPQSFQIISAGLDGLYGVGGQYSASANGEMLPVDPLHLINTSDQTIRTREQDNVTSFHNGKLE